MTKISYADYRFPPEIIQQAIWIWHWNIGLWRRRRYLVRPNARLGRGRFGKLLRTIGISFFQDETPSLRASSVSFRATHNVRM